MYMKIKYLSFLLILVLPIQLIFGQGLVNIIPAPQQLKVTAGVFIISSATTIVVEKQLTEKAALLNHFLEPAMGFNLTISSKSLKKNVIEFKLDPSMSQLGKEGYLLDIKPDKITIIAFHENGMVWAIQTLRQLLPNQILRGAPVIGNAWEIPCIKINDQPRFKWRGLMLDCSRTFIPREQVKKYIDAMSFFKMNILHMHLTDDQGWRLEIKQYPGLTSICSKIDTALHEPKEYDGFYTQDDIKELIAYAAQRNIEIVPEIEMPGHTSEIFAAYPQLSCKGDTLKIHSWVKGAGVHNDILCAGNDATIKFMENVIDEVSALFPSNYIHIGGDEAPKKFWKECPKCQKRIKDEGLKDENELQSWFVKRMEKYINSKGKNLIGWDEIMEGGLSETATVMYWRSWQKDVAKKIPTISNNMIMTPTSHCYFDYPNEKNTIEGIYSFNPIPAGMSENNYAKVLGVQANFWSHLDKTAPGMDRQLFPRLLALAEIAWTNNDKKDWNDFNSRVLDRLKSLDIMGIYYYTVYQ